jgi:hypothetical protein
VKARYYEAEGERPKKLLEKYARKLNAFIVWFWTYRNYLCLANKCFCGRCAKIGRKFSCADPVLENLQRFKKEVVAANAHIRIVSVTAEKLGSEFGLSHD